MTELPTTQYRSHWDEVPGHPVEDWRMEVINDDTRLGYVEWVKARESDAELEEESPQDSSTPIVKHRVEFWYTEKFFGHIDFDNEEDAKAFFQDPNYELIDTDTMCLCENQADPETPKPIQFTEVIFIPQAWIGDNAIEVDPEGPNTWLVESSKLQNIDPDQHESDNLRYHNNAPDWVREWSGPFYITWPQ